MKLLNEKGFTLIEAILTIAIASILMSAAYYYMGNSDDDSRLRSAASDLVSDMNLTRARAIRDSNAWAIKFDPSNNSYAIYSESGEASAPLNWTDGDETIFRTSSLPAAISFGSSQGEHLGVPVGNGVSHTNDLIVFNSNGTCSESGTIYLTARSGKTYAVTTLLATGQPKIWRNFGSGWTF